MKALLQKTLKECSDFQEAVVAFRNTKKEKEELEKVLKGSELVVFRDEDREEFIILLNQYAGDQRRSKRMNQ